VFSSASARSLAERLRSPSKQAISSAALCARQKARWAPGTGFHHRRWTEPTPGAHSDDTYTIPAIATNRADHAGSSRPADRVTPDRSREQTERSLKGRLVWWWQNPCDPDDTRHP